MRSVSRTGRRGKLLRAVKRVLALNAFEGIVAVPAALAIWHITDLMAHASVLPRPVQVFRGLLAMARSQSLVGVVRDSLVRVAVGCVLAAALAIPVGLLFARYSNVREAINPVVQMLRPISPLAWTPLAVVWFGIGNAAPIFLIFMAAFFPILV